MDKRRVRFHVGIFVQALGGLNRKDNIVKASNISGDAFIGLQNENVIIPFELKYNPMKKLALLNFEKNPDSVYNALELQYFDDQVYGEGYRVVAYRRDGYIDVYDDVGLNDIVDEDFNVAGKGLGEKKKVIIEDTSFEIEDGNLHISFNFVDKKGRDIVVEISECSPKSTRNLNLLAPVGHSSENPSCLPLYFLYEFDFVRKHRTDVEITIDGKRITLDSFPVPVPKDFQRRYYARYAANCQMVEFANASNLVLAEYQVGTANPIVHNSTEYFYADGILQKMVLRNSNYHFYVEFEYGFPDIRGMNDGELYQDTFNIIADESVGSVSGKYSLVRRGDIVRIELSPSGGWTPIVNSLLTKMMFGRTSVFCSWPKTYRYIQEININTLESISHWERVK